MDMNPEPRVVVVVVKGSAVASRVAAVLRWVRWLLPAALLIVSPTPLVRGDADDVITLNADAVESSPLAVADAIVKARGGR
jgi:hypothetical protein